MKPSLIDRMRRRPVQRVAAIVANQRGAQAKPHEIAGVYPAAEKAQNDELVQIERHPGVGVDVYQALCDDYMGEWINHAFDVDETRFLNSQAVSALGTFDRIDRPIVAGDAVRDLTWCGGETVQYVQSVDHEIVTDCWRYPLDTHKLSHVAREDVAYPFRERDGSPLPCGHSQRPCAHTPPVSLSKGHSDTPPAKDERAPGIGSLLKHFGLDGNRYVTTGGRVVHEPEPAAPIPPSGYASPSLRPHARWSLNPGLFADKYPNGEDVGGPVLASERWMQQEAAAVINGDGTVHQQGDEFHERLPDEDLTQCGACLDAHDGDCASRQRVLELITELDQLRSKVKQYERELTSRNLSSVVRRIGGTA